MIPRERGTYLLRLRLEQPATLDIGRLGRFAFPAGFYVYVGSAFGPGGLRGRLKHHLAPIPKPHWHLDYLRQAAPLEEIWCIARPEVLEHAWAALLHDLPGASLPAPRFGASDCRCPAHLFHTPARPDYTDFCQRAHTQLLRITPPPAPDSAPAGG